MNTTIHSLFIDVAGLRLHARVGAWERTGSTVVLVHGLGVSSRYMIPTLRALAPHVRVAAPDLPGFGRSSRPADIPDVSGLADWLLRWMDAASVESATLVGNSMGCQIIVDLAIRHPTRVERAVLVGPTLAPALRSPLPALWRLAVDTFREAPSQPFLVAVDYLSFGPRRLWRTYWHAVADRLEEKVPRMSAPTLVVRGSRDPIASDAWTRTLVRRMPQARLVTVEGAAHTVNYMAPHRLAGLVLDLMARRIDVEL